MEQILNKLSEIETTANYIMEKAAETKQKMTRELEAKCRKFDEQLEQETALRVKEIRQQLEKDKERELSALRTQTEELFAQMDSYYSQNHKELAQNLYHKIVKG